MQGKDGKVPQRGGGADFVDRALDFVGARHEDQRVARLGRMRRQRLGREFPWRRVTRRAFRMTDLHGKCSPSGLEDFAGGEVFLQLPHLQRGRHDDNFQIRTRGLLQVERPRQGDVAVKMTLVEFIEDDGRDPAQFRITDHAAEKDSLRDVKDARLGRAFALHPHLIADRLTERFPTLLSHPRSEHARGHAAWLEDNDLSDVRHHPIEEHLRHLRRFARARRGAENKS